MKLFLKVFLAICAAGCVFIVGCVAIVGVAADEAADSIEETRSEHEISQATWRKIKIGMTEQQVERAAGKEMRDRQDFEDASFIDGEPTRSSCGYYNVAGEGFLDVYQLCFQDGQLQSKNRW